MSIKGIFSLIPLETIQRWSEEDIGEEPFYIDFIDRTFDAYCRDRVAFAVKILLRAQARQILQSNQSTYYAVEAAQEELKARKRDLETAELMQEFLDIQNSARGRQHGKKNQAMTKVSEDVWTRVEIRMHDLHHLHPKWDKQRLLIELDREFTELARIEQKSVNNRFKHPKYLIFTFDDEVIEANREKCGLNL